MAANHTKPRGNIQSNRSMSEEVINPHRDLSCFLTQLFENDVRLLSCLDLISSSREVQDGVLT